MGVVFIKTIHKKHSFTLVELIVVLSILAILATLLIPSLTGYIEKAKKQAVLTEAKEVWTAAQAALSECYAMYPENFEESCKFTSTIGGEKMTKLGRISNGALNALQRNPKDQTDFKRYPYSDFPYKKGKVVAINFGKNGYMVTMIAGKEPTIVKDGNCLPSSEK